MHISEDLSMFVGLASIPAGKEREFFINDIKNGIFKNYKETMIKGGVSQNSKNDAEGARMFKELKKYFYEPKAYALFGNFDLAILSLIDDFTLSNRSFHPYSHLIGGDQKNKKTDTFNYQVLTGPSFKTFSSVPDENLLEKAKRTFLNTDIDLIKKLPFIGITCFKVNNALLLGAGAITVQVIELAIQGVIQKLIKKKKHGGKPLNLEFILTESYGWHEITAIFFSDNYRHISDVILRLRELRFSHLNEYCTYELKRRKEFLQGKLPGRNKLIQPEIDLLENYISHELVKTLKTIEQNSFLGVTINNKENKSFSQTNVDFTHVFINSYTILGMDINFAEDNNKRKSRLNTLSKSNLEFFSKWHTKPGHLAASVELHYKSQGISDSKKELKDINMILGSGDFAFPETGSSLKDVVSANILLSEDSKKLLHLEHKSHITKISSIPYIKYKYGALQRELDKEGLWLPLKKCMEHAFINQELVKYAFTLTEIKLIREKLFDIKSSKILREKVLNMYANFNDGIQDPVLYSYFIELRPYLKEIQTLIIYKYSDISNLSTENTYSNKYLNEIQQELDLLVDHFDKAFKNRFHQSYRMNEITDFNMEHNGGIQQIVSAFDATYKSIARVLGENEPISFIIVSGLSGIDSSLYNLRLNAFHVFYPSLFVAVIVKEAANKFLQKKYFKNATETQLKLDLLENFKEILRDKRKKEAWINQVIDSNYKAGSRFGKYDMAEVLNWLDEQMIDYFIADSISYGYGYADKCELFTYWWWNYIMQLSEEYDKDGGFNEQAFIKVMMRFTFLSLCFDEFKNKWEQITAQPPSPILNHFWFQYKDRILDAFRLIERDLNKNVIELIYNLIDSIIYNSRNPTDTPKDVHTKIFNDLALENNLGTTQPNGNFFIGAWNEEVSKIAEMAKKQITLGRIFAYQKDKTTPQQYLIGLFTAYLTMIFEFNNTQKGRQQIINRKIYEAKGDTAHREIPVNAIQYVPLAFDSMGGFFTTDAHVRRKFFQARSVFIKSLYDFSLKTKLDLLK